MKIGFPLSVHPGKWVLELENMGKAFGDNRLFEGVNITVGRGEKIALLGANGTGKSTLLKRVMNQLDGEGSVTYGHNVNIAYFAQDQAESLDKSLSVLETVDQVAKGEIRKRLRSVLGAFLFQGDDVDKKVSVLSGGERTRLALCQLLLSPSNFLILDEPTNHLDIQSKEVLKNALKSYEGTFIVVSHDREFLDGLTNRIWEIEDRNLRIHHFDVKEFLKRKSEQQQQGKASEKVESKTQEDKNTSKPALSYQEEKELKRKKNKLKNQVNKAEKEIERLETEIAEMDEIIADLNYDDKEKAESILGKYHKLKETYDQQMKLWEDATEGLMEIED
jgi:ATP-binding cassette subfamily F protein 3